MPVTRTAVAGNVIVDGWTVLDLASAPLTGMTTPADIELVLQRQSGSAMVAAAESVAFPEIGSTGRYSIVFTPVNSGLYILYLKELHASSLGRTDEFRYEIVSAGATYSPSYSQAFCAESDIEMWLQQGIDSTTNPDDTEAAAFAESRAAILMALLSKWGVTVTPSTVTAGSVLEDLLRRANSIGAALDYTVAQQLAYRPNVSDRAERFQILWDQLVSEDKDAPGALFVEAHAQICLATDHILSGDTLAAASASVQGQDVGIQVGMGSLF